MSKQSAVASTETTPLPLVGPLAITNQLPSPLRILAPWSMEIVLFELRMLVLPLITGSPASHLAVEEANPLPNVEPKSPGTR